MKVKNNKTRRINNNYIYFLDYFIGSLSGNINQIRFYNLLTFKSDISINI